MGQGKSQRIGKSRRRISRSDGAEDNEEIGGDGMKIKGADLFCGAGGTTCGVKDACDELDHTLDLLAVNHCPIAIESHTRNHPYARHLCEELDAVNPRKAVPGGRLHIMVASPECTGHSNARGDMPTTDQSRCTAWHVLRWAEALQIDNLLIENVREFTYWGPLGSNGRPLKSRRGETFQAFLGALRSLGYTVDYRFLTAADYGDATTRERLFIMARRGRRQIKWPSPTHAQRIDGELFRGTLKPWRPAREIIDWSIPGTSIFGRKRPLSVNTIARIAAGLKRFGGPRAEPFLVLLRGTSNGHVNSSARSINQPLPTITAKGQHLGLVVPDPFIVPANYGERPGQKPRCHSIDSPLPTVVGSNTHALVEPFIIACNHGKDDSRSYSLSRPFPTVTTIDAWGIVDPFIVKYNGTAKGAYSLDEPLDTIATRDRFGLVEQCGLDIRFRMLKPHELACAHSMDGYDFAGTREAIVKQIGNGVPRRMAKALCMSLLAS
jgi:DNA (cytosine-5)-methyltransferase 1